MWSTIISILVIYIIACLILYWVQEKFIFFPTTLPKDYSFKQFRNFEEVYFKNGNNSQVHALHFKVPKPKGLVLYFHGNARALDTWAYAANDFIKRGYEVLMQDYRSYGKSEGTLSEKALHKDAMMIYNELNKKHHATDIIIYGRSLGTGIACQLATQVKARMVILETPYLSLVEMAKKKLFLFPVSLLLRYRMRNDLNIKKVQCPVHIFHGTEDELIPYEHAQRLEKLHGSKKILTTINEGTHNNLTDFDLFQDKLDDLLNEIVLNDQQK